MKPIEIKLTRKFKEQQKLIEDLFMTKVTDIMAEYADKRGQEKYNEVKSICNELKETLSKMEDNNLESFTNNIDEYSKRQTLLADKVAEIQEYFASTKTFSKELLKLIEDITTLETDKLHEIIITAQLLNCHKTANNLKFQFKKLIDIVTYILNESVQETISIYKSGMNNLIKEVGELADKKIELCKNLISEYEENDISKEYKKEIYKIFSYKYMNKLLEINGYEPDRQTGDHKIYKSKDGKKSIPVPQRNNLGKGLSFSIQKQI